MSSLRCCSRSAASARASGLGGEWGGAVLLATENAPPGKRAWYGMFPQLGAPIGFFFSSAIFLGLSKWLTPAEFLSYGWRLPFLASGVLVLLGLYVRLTITETPVFAAAMERREAVKVPIFSVVKNHFGALVAGTLTCLATFVLFYLMIVFTSPGPPPHCITPRTTSCRCNSSASSSSRS